MPIVTTTIDRRAMLRGAAVVAGAGVAGSALVQSADTAGAGARRTPALPPCACA